MELSQFPTASIPQRKPQFLSSPKPPTVSPVSTKKSSLTSPSHFPGGSDGKESACNAGDLGSIPGSGRSPGEGLGYPLQYSGLENPKDREAWRAAVHGVAKGWT